MKHDWVALGLACTAAILSVVQMVMTICMYRRGRRIQEETFKEWVNK